MSYVFAARIHLTNEKRKQNRLTVCNSIEAFRASINSYCFRVKQAEQSAKLFKRFPGRIAKTVKILSWGHTKCCNWRRV